MTGGNRMNKKIGFFLIDTPFSAVNPETIKILYDHYLPLKNSMDTLKIKDILTSNQPTITQIPVQVIQTMRGIR